MLIYVDGRRQSQSNDIVGGGDAGGPAQKVVERDESKGCDASRSSSSSSSSSSSHCQRGDIRARIAHSSVVLLMDGAVVVVSHAMGEPSSARFPAATHEDDERLPSDGFFFGSGF